MFISINVDALLRGDFATRTEGYASAIVNGWMNRNEVRALENMDPAEGLDEFLTPMNLAGDEEEEEDEDEEEAA